MEQITIFFEDELLRDSMRPDAKWNVYGCPTKFVMMTLPHNYALLLLNRRLQLQISTALEISSCYDYICSKIYLVRDVRWALLSRDSIVDSKH